ncbi:MAG: hypothetical protein SNJ72_07270, partial [Fimbriimonadales bacterium]
EVRGYATPAPPFTLPAVATIWAILLVPSAWLLQIWSAQGYLHEIERYLPYDTIGRFSQRLVSFTLSLYQQVQGVFG